jgi:hypothetical protein
MCSLRNFDTTASYDLAYLEQNVLGQTFVERNYRHVLLWDGIELAVTEARPVLPVGESNPPSHTEPILV